MIFEKLKKWKQIGDAARKSGKKREQSLREIGGLDGIGRDVYSSEEVLAASDGDIVSKEEQSADAVAFPHLISVIMPVYNV